MWKVPKKSASGNGQVGKVDAKTNDFAWEVLEKLRIQSVRGRGCVGKAADSCERGDKNGHNNKSATFARHGFVEAKRAS